MVSPTIELGGNFVSEIPPGGVLDCRVSEGGSQVFGGEGGKYEAKDVLYVPLGDGGVVEKEDLGFI